MPAGVCPIITGSIYIMVMKIEDYDECNDDCPTVLFISALLYPEMRKRIFLQTAAVAIASSHTLMMMMTQRMMMMMTMTRIMMMMIMMMIARITTRIMTSEDSHSINQVEGRN